MDWLLKSPIQQVRVKVNHHSPRLGSNCGSQTLEPFSIFQGSSSELQLLLALAPELEPRTENGNVERDILVTETNQCTE
jgi:hypothetical protein